MLRPNLFTIATKELSQDAFLTWLLQWADLGQKQNDSELHKCAQAFVRLLLNKKSDFKITSVRATRQWHNIDIKAEINGDTLLIIEDKKHAHEHGQQLDSYYKSASKWCNDPKRGTPWSLACVYLKTGDESANSLKEIKKRNFEPVGRGKLMDLFHEFKGIDNDIFRDFVGYLDSLETAVSGFATKAWNQWTHDDWKGFFLWIETQQDIEKIKWFSIDAPSGRFWACLLTWFSRNSLCSLFLQIESPKAQLCIKMTVDAGEFPHADVRDMSLVRDHYRNYVMEEARKRRFLHVVKPDHLGRGKYMTVAVVKPEHWLGPVDKPFDAELVKAKLERYTAFVKECIKSWPSQAPGGQSPLPGAGPVTW